MTTGCDLASYQGTVDLDQLKTAVDFAFVKATEGTGYTDRQFGRNWREVKRVGIRRGAYHFARPDLGNPATIEADWFIDQILGEGGFAPGDMLALDYEVEWSGDVVAWCRTWLERVEAKTGIRPYIYLNLYLASVYDWGDIERPGGYPLWLAYYDGKPAEPIHTMWPSIAIKQWTSSGTLPGVVGLVDLNTALEEAMATPQETYDAIAPLLQEKIVAPQHDTNTYFGQVLAQLVAHQLNPNDLAAGILARVQANLAKILSGATPPVPPSCPAGTTYFGESADGSAIGWTYPDGTTHYFLNGVEAK